MTDGRHLSRRSFLQAVLGAAAAPGPGDAGAPTPGGAAPLPTRPLGRTGHQVTLLGLGGQAALEDPARRDRSRAIVERALALGVNYLDTAPTYGGGASEEVLGEALRGRRDRVFLASKTRDRSYDGAMRQLEGSLRRLRTDHLDLWQVHDLGSDADLALLRAREGALRAMERARAEGVVRFLGVTGHQDPRVLRRALVEHPFDAVLLPVNAADRHGASFIDQVLPAAVERGMAVLGMKVAAAGAIFREGGLRTMEQAMRYALSQPVSAVVVGMGDLADVEADVAIARAFRPCPAAELAELERLTRPYAADALAYRGH